MHNLPFSTPAFDKFYLLHTTTHQNLNSLVHNNTFAKMATKRVFDDSNDKDQDNPNDKRMRSSTSRPSFASYALLF